MILVGIDVGKFKHSFSVTDKYSGELLIEPKFFDNNLNGFKYLTQCLSTYKKSDLLIGMEDTGHYHFALLKYLLNQSYSVALVNSVTTNLTRKMQGSSAKNDSLDTMTICDVLASNQRKKNYRITTVDNFNLYEQKLLTRHHHNLKEETNIYTNRLQKCIDVVFPEFNSLFKSKYGVVYMNILKMFGSAHKISNTNIQTIRKCFETGKGRNISLTAEQLKEAAKHSVGFNSISDEIQIKHLIAQIELINEQLEEIDKKIEEFSTKTNSPIITIPGISHFSGTSILAELGDINNYSSPAKIIKFAGVEPIVYESSTFTAQHTAITKKGSKYLRKTLYQIIIPVIQNNEVFKKFYLLKRSQGKSHRCAQGHCIRKLLRVIYHLETTGQAFDPSLLR